MPTPIEFRRASATIMSARALVIAVFAVVLAAPAAASAATITVDPAAAAGCAANVCNTIAAANGAAVDGDTISIKNGTYTEVPIVVTKHNLIFTAQTPGAVTVTSSSTTAGADVFTLGNNTATNGDGTTLKGLVVNVQANGGHAVLVQAKGTTVDSCSLIRQGTNDQDTAAYEVGDAVVGSNTVKATIVLNNPTAQLPHTSPALAGGDASSLVLTDDFIASGLSQGDAIAFTGNATGGSNTLTRVAALAFSSGGNAVSILSAGTSAVAKELKIDTSILSGGVMGAGLLTKSESAAMIGTTTAGDIHASLVHATLGGSGLGVVVDADAQGNLLSFAPRGSIAVEVDRSILHGSSTVRNNDGLLSPIVLPANTASLAITQSDTPQVASSDTGSTVTVANSTNTPDALLFRNVATKNLHLRADAPVINKGGPQVAGESTTDIDGQPRVNGPASDLGADEFVNLPPTAALAVSNAKPRQNEQVTFDATKSSDPEAGFGGKIAEYHWDFGDGQTATTNTATVQHAYANVGAVSAKLVVVDNFGAASAATAPVALTVSDGTPPKVTIATPKKNQKLKLFSSLVKKTKAKDGTVKRTTVLKRRTLRFFGTASDDKGVAGVEVALRRVSVTKTAKKKKATPAAKAAVCIFFDGKRAFVRRSCSAPPFYKAGFASGAWSSPLKSTVKLRAGVYELLVRATDTNGNVSAPVTVRFKLV
jgi:hypothetical protein